MNSPEQEDFEVMYSPTDSVNAGRPVSRWRRFRQAAALAMAFTLPVAAWNVTGDQLAPAFAEAPAAAPAEAAARSIGAGQDSYAPIVDAVAPAVVTIHAEQRVRTVRQTQMPFTDDPLFREFFGNRIPSRPDEGEMPGRRAQGLGSGVIVSRDGHILTNHHVISDADRIRVELTDGRSLTATVIGSDAPSDLAVLKVEAPNLPVVPLGNSDTVRVGDVVLAVGNPMGVGQTVTLGIVSAKGRSTRVGDGSFEDFIQTDAAINRGNSGGALVNTRGEIVGINSQILSPSGGNIGIGFSIPANMARHVMESLIANGRVHRGLLGVTVQTITPQIASSLGMDVPRGALVSSVTPDGPAGKAGLQRGDVVTAIDGATVPTSNDLRNRIASTAPGSEVTLTVLRDGRERTITATLGELPSAASANAGAGADERTSGTFGLAVEPLTRDRARALGVTEGEGVVVAAVTNGSPAADAGFRRGDVIEQVNGRTPRTPGDLREALTASGERPALVLVRRGDQSIYLTLSRD